MKNEIRVERAKVKMTQQELADRLGLSRQTINSVELDRYIPSTVLSLKIAAVFQTTVNNLFELEEGD